MVQPGSFPIEDFLEAITSQLDKTQDALRLKAVNRPLTFALKDFELNLKVFVEMDQDGQIRFRPGGINETGTSTVTIGFTTITRSMIDENTISLELTQSPTLDEAGLDPQEQKRLEKLGVRNTLQLKRLEEKAGGSNLSRLTGVNIDKLRQALKLGQPRIDAVGPSAEKEPPPEKPPEMRDPFRPRKDKPIAVKKPRIDYPRSDEGTRYQLGERPGRKRPMEKESETEVVRPKLRIAPGTRQIRLKGGNLIDRGLAPEVRLDNQRLDILKARDDEVQVMLPRKVRPGILSVTFPDGAAQAYDLMIDMPVQIEPIPPSSDNDPWLPEGGAM
jgi:hypothetical protein